jgi:hypothetical protein
MASLRARPRRGAWGEGSRRASAFAAACFAVLALGLGLPSQAAAFPCGDGVAPTASTRQLMSAMAPDECRTPEKGDASIQPRREPKRGNVNSLAVFVLAVAAALLIPIGRKGLPHGGDPFGHDPTHQPPSPESR